MPDVLILRHIKNVEKFNIANVGRCFDKVVTGIKIQAYVSAAYELIH